ncbi:uncharacterized protein FIBRA_03726 [Fibroporia radiculosa]|uniref:Uncharacterized protein n=1 Tax=Fibroporia radiculosa TaxID=599839 RepID=J4G683_9APHY|nr:uncharacterized protein FIBRA_03726 [Fibroporia radiculosa]CCM01663.1 predicted protein [Fibroporia radiculosa]
MFDPLAPFPSPGMGASLDLLDFDGLYSGSYHQTPYLRDLNSCIPDLGSNSAPYRFTEEAHYLAPNPHPESRERAFFPGTEPLFKNALQLGLDAASGTCTNVSADYDTAPVDQGPVFPFSLFEDLVGRAQSLRLDTETSDAITRAPLLSSKELPPALSYPGASAIDAHAILGDSVDNALAPTVRSQRRFSPYPSPSSWSPSPLQSPVPLAPCPPRRPAKGSARARNRQVYRSDADFVDALIKALDTLVCPVPDCGYTPSGRHNGDLERHLRTHRARPDEGEWACCGVLVPENYMNSMDPNAMYLHKGRLMMGGCQRVFSRKDALGRHLKERKGKCRGDLKLAEQLSKS